MSQLSSFEDSVAFEKNGSDQYVSRQPMQGNSLNPNDKVAYGGCTLAFAVNVGYATVDNAYRLYSCLGQFLGPAMAGERLLARVTILRDSRSFATRRVELFQYRGQHDEKSRLIVSMQMDFQLPEKRSLLTYNVRPKVHYSSPETSWDEARMRLYASEQGTPEKLLRVMDKAMLTRKKYFDVRSPPESTSSHTLHGMLPHLRTQQMHLDMTEKTACYYWGTFEPLHSPATNAAALAFLLDAGMPVIPVAFSGVNWSKVASATSLDFAIRIFKNNIDAHRWLKREEQTLGSGEGRSYQEARVWDEQGNLIASMTEQCLLRPVDNVEAKL